MKGENKMEKVFLVIFILLPIYAIALVERWYRKHKK
jgi:hypothetical protein